MANTIEIVIRATDDASKVISNIESKIAESANTFSNWSKVLRESFDAVGMSTEEVNKRLVRYGAATTDAAKIQHQLSLAQNEVVESSQKLAKAQQELMRNTDPRKHAELEKEVAKTQVQLDRSAESVKKYKDELDGVNTSTEKGVQGFESFAGKLVAIQAGIGVAKEAIAGLKAVWNFAKEGAQNQQIADSFERTAKSIGANADDIIKKLDAAAKGTIDDQALMQASTRALTLGAAKSGDDLVKVMQLARGAALQFGGDTAAAFESINYAIGNLTPRTLKQYGIIVSTKDANEAYAASIGVSVDSLTEEQQRQALLNAALEQGAKNFGDVGNSAAITAEKMQGVEVRLNNIIDDVKEFAALGFETLFLLTDAPQNLMDAYYSSVEKMKKDVIAGKMSVEDYNKALYDIALKMRDFGVVMRTVDVDAQKLSGQMVVQMQVMGGVTTAANLLTGAIEGVAQANKNAAAAAEANKATNLSALTPEQQQAAVTAYQAYQSKISGIEVKGDQERVKIVQQAMDELAKLEENTGQKRSDIISQFASDEASRLSDMNDKRIDILMGYSENEQKITEQQYKDRMKLARDFGIETERMEQDHQRMMERMGEDHTRNLRKLADSRDALAIEDEQESYQIERRRAEEDYQVKAAQRNEDYARQLAEQNAAFEEQRKQRADDRDKQLADLQKNFDKQDVKYKAAYQKQLNDLDKQAEEQRRVIWSGEAKKLADIGVMQAAERVQALSEWTTWRQQHEIFFAGEKQLYDDYLKYTYDQLQAYITNKGVAAPAATTPHPTTIPGGKYAAGANFIVPAGYPGDSFPMRVSSGERVSVTPAGRGGNMPPINITQSFSGAQAEPEKYKAIMYEVITDVIEQAMRQ